MSYKKISIGLGLVIIVITHIAMIFDFIPMSTMLDKRSHAIANLIAAILIGYGVYY